MTDLVPFVQQSTALVLSDHARLTRGGLAIDPEATEDDLRSISQGMANLLSTSWFVLGDLANYWKRVFPSGYREWISGFGELEAGTIVRYAAVCRRFPDPGWRERFMVAIDSRRALTFGHFNAVRTLTDEKAEQWLEYAATNGIGVKTLMSVVKDSTEEKQPIIAPPSSADTMFGYIYELGDGHRLLCGDSSVPEHVAALFGDDRARLVVTSPPYNQQLDTFQASGMQTEKTGWIDRMSSAYDDSRPEQEYQDEQVRVIDSLIDVTTPDASLFYNHKNRYRDKEVVSPLLWLLRTKWRLRQEIIWDRGASITLNARMFAPSDERLYWMRRGDDFVWNDESEAKIWFTVWKIAPRAVEGVSAPFPIEIPSRPIVACSDPGDIVFDPYGGSGTTLIAAAQHGRRCFLVERDPAYCDVIRDRYARLIEDLKASLPIIDSGPARMPEE